MRSRACLFTQESRIDQKMPLGKRSEFGDARYAGVEINFAHDVAEQMKVGHPNCCCSCYCCHFGWLRRTDAQHDALCHHTQEYLLCGFDFVVAPLVQPHYQQPPLPSNASAEASAVISPNRRTELMLTSAAFGSQVRGTYVLRTQWSSVKKCEIDYSCWIGRFPLSFCYSIWTERLWSPIPIKYQANLVHKLSTQHSHIRVSLYHALTRGHKGIFSNNVC